MKKILMIDNGQEFGLDEYLIKPIGGSESSFLMIGKSFAEIGNSVVILNNSKIPQRGYNIIIDNNKLTQQFSEISDIIILNRINPLPFLHLNKPILVYSHDAYDQENTHWMANKDIVNLVHKILCVSEWQKQTFIEYFNVDPNKLVVVGNPLDLELYVGYYNKRDLNKLIFASIPYKGLEFLNDIINDVVITTNNSKIKLHVFSSMGLYGREEQDNEYDQIFSELSRNNNIVLRKPVSMKELALEFMTSNMYIHPNIYHETFGMVLIQAQASGCLPITTNSGAVNEVVENKDMIINSPNIYNHETYKKFIDLICKNIYRENYNKRINAQNFVKKFDRIKISRHILDLI